MAAKSYKILMTSLDGPDYIRSTLNLATILVDRGHEVYMLLRLRNKDSCEVRCLNFIAFEEVDPDYEDLAEPVEIPGLADSMTKVNKPPLERAKNWSSADNAVIMLLLRELIILDKLMRKVLDAIPDFDAIIGDTIYPTAVFMEGKIPTIQILSSNPIGLYHARNYVAGTGISVFSDKKIWEKYREKDSVINERLCNEFNDYYSEFNLEITDMHSFRACVKYLGIYIFPEVLDYTPHLGPPPSNWFRCDPVVRKSTKKFVIPEKLAKKTGKLIFISISTITETHLEIMQRLVETLTKSRHRYIIVRGPRSDQLKLPRNMWGERELDSISVLPEVDMMIGHGHCETIYESLYHGKPIMVMPLFFNQLDNAQRVEDLQIGARFNPFEYKDSELLAKIEKLLFDRELRERVNEISEQIRMADNRHEAAFTIEEVIRTGIPPPPPELGIKF